MAARILIAVLSLLVLAWVGVLLRDFETGYDASIRGFYGPTPTGRAGARDLERLSDAELLDPSAYWRLARGSYYLQSGRLRHAARIAEDLVSDEPQNIQAWGVLREATKRSDPGRSRRAAAEIRRLNPLGS